VSLIMVCAPEIPILAGAWERREHDVGGKAIFPDSRIALRNVTVRYGRRVALEAVSGEFAPGSLTAIVGANGAILARGQARRPSREVDFRKVRVRAPSVNSGPFIAVSRAPDARVLFIVWKTGADASRRARCSVAPCVT
jgi:hypothetical protein